MKQFLYYFSAFLFCALLFAACAPVRVSAQKKVKSRTANSVLPSSFIRNPAPVKFSLPAFESDVLAEINDLRRNPAAYIAYLEEHKKHYEKNVLKLPNQTPVVTNEGATAVDEAITFLKTVKAADDLLPVRGLTDAANDHLQDLITKNITGHRGSNGSLPDERISKRGAINNGEIKELIGYFALSPRQIVINFLIDDGNKNRPHRTALFKSNLKQIGITTDDSRKYGKLCVVVMAETFVENLKQK